MHCYICDRQLSDAEIIWNSDYKQWEPCGECLEISLDAAFSGGFNPEASFSRGEPLGDYKEITETPAEVDTLDIDVFSSEDPPTFGRRTYDPAKGGAVGYFDE